MASVLQLEAQPVWGWAYMLDGPAGGSDGAFGVLVDSSGNVISGGHLQGSGYEIVLIKHSGADASELWRHSLPGSSDVGGIHSFEDANGDILTTINRQLPTGALSSVLPKLSPDGSELWQVDVPDVRLYAADSDNAGNLVAAGSLAGSPSGDLFVIAVGSSGIERWRRTISEVSPAPRSPTLGARSRVQANATLRNAGASSWRHFSRSRRLPKLRVVASGPSPDLIVGLPVERQSRPTALPRQVEGGTRTSWSPSYGDNRGIYL